MDKQHTTEHEEDEPPLFPGMDRVVSAAIQGQDKNEESQGLLQDERQRSLFEDTPSMNRYLATFS